MKKISLIVLMLTSAMVHAAPFDSCGLSGSLSKRLRSCRKVAEKNAERRFIYISREMQNDPLAGLDDSPELIWKLVSRSESGAQIWLNENTKQYWAFTGQSFDFPVAVSTVQNMAKTCDELKLVFNKKSVAYFELPTAESWSLALDQSFGRVLPSIYEQAFGYNAQGELTILGDSEQAHAASVVCISSK